MILKEILSFTFLSFHESFSKQGLTINNNGEAMHFLFGIVNF